MSNSQLAGIRVIDLSQFLPGPYAGQICADMGADVLKVEPPDGDPMRQLNPVTNQRGPAPFHKIINAGKRVVRIDLKSVDGKSAFRQLLSKADILLESYRPGVMERLGLGFEDLRQLNPRLIHCALSGYGQSGPLRARSGHDVNYMAMSGSLNVTGPAPRPQPAFPPVADYAGAMQAVISILAALLGRSSSGTGCYLDIAMADTMLAWQSFGLTQQGLSQSDATPAPKRAGNLLNGGAACYQVYATADDMFVALGAIETHFWENFCNAVDRQPWIVRHTDPLPQTDLIAEVSDLFLTRTRDQWDQSLGDIDCCYHPVLDYGELPEWPQIQARQLLDFDAESGDFQGVRLPVWQDGRPPSTRQPMREITQHDALAAWL
ncbi:MAG: CoA transferase [Rhodospirillales bacterium]|nr:CoA transferase [Rhodospirillales bacterium]